jgi:hypothetical protein
MGFEQIGKNKNVQKSRKKFRQNGWIEISFLLFSELLGPKEKREG